METLNTIVQIINMTGFPIFCVLALGRYVTKITDKMEDTLVEMKLVIEKNTSVIEELSKTITKGK